MNEELNLKGTAAVIGVHPKTVKDWIVRKMLRGERRGPKVWRVIRRDAEEFKRKYRELE